MPQDAYELGTLLPAFLLVSVVVWRLVRALRRDAGNRRALAAWVIALALSLVYGAISLTPEGNDTLARHRGDIKRNDRRDFVAGCVDSGGARAMCECLAAEIMVHRGYDTHDEMRRLMEKVHAARARNDPASAPRDFIEAARACVG